MLSRVRVSNSFLYRIDAISACPKLAGALAIKAYISEPSNFGLALCLLSPSTQLCTSTVYEQVHGNGIDSDNQRSLVQCATWVACCGSTQS